MPRDFIEYRRKKRNHVKKVVDNEFQELLGKIKFLERKNNYESAINLIDDYNSKHQTNDYLTIYKAMILYKLCKKEDAINMLENILNNQYLSKKDEVFAMTQYANILSDENKIEEAIYYYNRLIEISSDLEIVARGKLSTLYSSKRNFEKALDILNIDGYNNQFLNNKRAYVYLEMGKRNLALKELERPYFDDKKSKNKISIEDKYMDQEKNYIYGHIYHEKQMPDEALSYLYKCLTLKNKNIYFLAYVDILRILIFKNNIEEVIKICKELKSQSPSKFFASKIEELEAKAYSKKHDFNRAFKKYEGVETNDVHKSINLGRIELIKGNFEKAEEYFSNINLDRLENYDEIYRYALVKFRLKKYDEALDLVKVLQNKTSKNCVNKLKLFYEMNRLVLSIKKNMNQQINDGDYTYSEMQIISYDRQKAIDHIMDHHVTNSKSTIFNENIDVPQFYDDVKELMNGDNVIYDSVFDKYVIKYNNVGRDLDGSIINQLYVITLAGTKDIITMYPYDGPDSYIFVEELEDKPKPKVKRLSQIDKFNMRYNKGN